MNLLLHNMNPSIKFVIVTVSMIVMAFFFNPITPLLFCGGIILFQLLFSRINWKLWMFSMLPFLIAAFGYLWTTLIFANSSTGNIIWTPFFLEITDQQLDLALSLTFRVLAFSMLSLLFAFTTDPVKFVMSLMQQLKLTPKLAYSVLVGYHFLPFIKDEFLQIKQVHKMRTHNQPTSKWHRSKAVYRMLIPTLAGAVRKAERAAFAMEARGFTGEARQSFFHPIIIKQSDILLSMLFGILLIGSCTIGVTLSR